MGPALSLSSVAYRNGIPFLKQKFPFLHTLTRLVLKNAALRLIGVISKYKGGFPGGSASRRSLGRGFLLTGEDGSRFSTASP
ncbi:hypothetical protein MPNT_70083 [Candidatus Methylacidithermus pantelleriae]|uniref:Uncharacterized protein n=1 Tax=Candidatus Methylacidithermus pantelleriae TaxID=2744239 RepID=A0A8J2BPM2_9BACT|nr:hypothetical protein MPNT_70083 [Candidatus Methylacidithermus pantelleriae]